MNGPKGFEKTIKYISKLEGGETEWQMLRLKERVGGSSGERQEGYREGRGEREREREREVSEGM